MRDVKLVCSKSKLLSFYGNTRQMVCTPAKYRLIGRLRAAFTARASLRPGHSAALPYYNPRLEARRRHHDVVTQWLHP